MRETGGDPMQRQRKKEQKDDNFLNVNYGVDPMQKLGQELGQFTHSGRSHFTDDFEENEK